MQINSSETLIPSHIIAAMENFTNGSLINVDRIPRDRAMKEAHCHGNVEKWVKLNGGKVINGWMLFESKNYLSQGVWVWVFHSLWMSDSGSLFEITDQGVSHDNSKTIFFADKSRRPNLIKGMSYNNVVIIENLEAAISYGEKLNVNLDPAVLYWAAPNMLYFKKIDQHGGVYRMLGPNYKGNNESFEKLTGVNVNIAKLFGSKIVDPKYSLDFGV